VSENEAPTIVLLKGLQVTRDTQSMRMTYWWCSNREEMGQIIGEGLFLLVSLFFSIYLMLTLTRAENMTLIQWATTLPFILIGLFITYRGLSVFINSSVFEITPREFKASSGPLPFLGEKALRLSPGEITRVEWREIGYAPSTKQISRQGSGTSTTYDVVVVTTQGKSEKIISSLSSREYALAIQGELSRSLKLNE